MISTLRNAKHIYYKCLFYSTKSRQVKVGNNLKLLDVPDLYVSKNSKLIIGNNVLFRSDIEIRIDNESTIIIGNNCRIDKGVRLIATNGSSIILDNDVRVGLGSVFNGGCDILIGAYTLISGYVFLQTSMHTFNNRNMPIQKQGYQHGPVQIGTDVWIGAHAVILPGCIIGEGSIIGSNAVVTKSVDEYTVVGGIPAKFIKTR